MTNAHRITTSERAGRCLGQVWSGLLRRDARVARWMVEHGASRPAAKASLWIIKLALVIALGYVFLWLALLIGVVLIAAKLVQHGEFDLEQPAFEPTDPHDHRQRLFYDPLAHNDDPDPRFEDD